MQIVNNCVEKIFPEDIKYGRLVIPEGITEIKGGAADALDGCKAVITRVKLPTSLKIIGRNAFRGQPLDSLKIPYGVEKIDDYAFFNVTIRSVTMEDSVKQIGENAFGNRVVYCKMSSEVRENNGIFKVNVFPILMETDDKFDKISSLFSNDKNISVKNMHLSERKSLSNFENLIKDYKQTGIFDFNENCLVDLDDGTKLDVESYLYFLVEKLFKEYKNEAMKQAAVVYLFMDDLLNNYNFQDVALLSLSDKDGTDGFKIFDLLTKKLLGDNKFADPLQLKKKLISAMGEDKVAYYSNLYAKIEHKKKQEKKNKINFNSEVDSYQNINKSSVQVIKNEKWFYQNFESLKKQFNDDLIFKFREVFWSDSDNKRAFKTKELISKSIIETDNPNREIIKVNEDDNYKIVILLLTLSAIPYNINSLKLCNKNFNINNLLQNLCENFGLHYDNYLNRNEAAKAVLSIISEPFDSTINQEEYTNLILEHEKQQHLIKHSKNNKKNKPFEF